MAQKIEQLMTPQPLDPMHHLLNVLEEIDILDKALATFEGSSRDVRGKGDSHPATEAERHSSSKANSTERHASSPR